MTVIESISGTHALAIGECPTARGNIDVTVDGKRGVFVRAEVFKALGIDELGCGCDEADNLKAALKRAEEAEAELQELQNSPWKARCQVARDDANTARQLAEFHRDRALAAEASIERVRALTVDGDGEWVHVGDLRGALDPKPAFKQVILTSDLSGVHVNGYDFAKGVLTKLPAEDADRLIAAGLAKEAS